MWPLTWRGQSGVPLSSLEVEQRMQFSDVTRNHVYGCMQRCDYSTHHMRKPASAAVPRHPIPWAIAEKAFRVSMLE